MTTLSEKPFCVTDKPMTNEIPENEPRIIAFDEADDNARLDKALVRHCPELSRTRLQSLIAEGAIKRIADGSVLTNAKHKVKAGDEISLIMPALKPALPQGEDIPLDIPYEDDDLIVINKPAGLVVHPGNGNETGTLVNALIAHCGDSLSGVGGEARPGIVHRIDKDTSGLLVVAKHDRAHQGLAAQFAAHDLTRAYLAFVWGAPSMPKGTVDARIARSQHNRTKMTIVKGETGRHAVTHYAIQKRYGPPHEPVASLVECRLETGRTHQIRVHMTHIGHPLIADAVYGRGLLKKRKGLTEDAADYIADLGRQALHAAELGFVHPISGETLHFSAPLPTELAQLATYLAATPVS